MFDFYHFFKKTNNLKQNFKIWYINYILKKILTNKLKMSKKKLTSISGLPLQQQKLCNYFTLMDLI